jgi:hypothetical protein
MPATTSQPCAIPPRSARGSEDWDYEDEDDLDLIIFLTL